MTTRIEYRVSSIKHRVSRIEYQESSIKHRESTKLLLQVLSLDGIVCTIPLCTKSLNRDTVQGSADELGIWTGLQDRIDEKNIEY
jgi:hypothetical protein